MEGAIRMSDTFTTDVQGDAPEGETPENANLRQLREKAKAGEQALAKLAEFERKDAIRESGIDTNTPLGKLFLKSYDGELTADALKEAAGEYGVPIVGQAPAEDVTPPENGTEERQALADGAGADTGVSPDPNQVAHENFKADMAAGMSEEAGIGTFIATKARAAHMGDPRVIYVPPAER